MRNRTLKNLIFLFFLITIALWFFSRFVIYLLISIIISTILRPFTNYLDNLGIFGFNIPRILAVLISFVALTAIPVIFVLLFVPLIIEQISVLQGLNYQEIIDNLREPISLLENYIILNFQPDKKSGFLFQMLRESSNSWVADLQIADLLNYLLQFTGSVVIYLVSVGFMTFILLYEKGLIRRILLSNIHNAYFEVVITTIYKIERLLSNYLLGLLIQVAIMFSVISLGLSIMGVKYALTIAVFMAIINLIPYLGPAIGFLFAIFVVVSTHANGADLNLILFHILSITPVFIGAIALDNLVIQPIIFSKSVKAHPLEIFMAIFAGATLAGPLGMLIAIPSYTVLRVSYRELSSGYRQYKIFTINKNTREAIKLH